MDGLRGYLSEITQGKTNTMWYNLYVESNFFKITNKFIYKTEMDWLKFMVAKEEAWGDVINRRLGWTYTDGNI